MNIFVTGTDTGIGKTVVSAILALKLESNYWKPIQSGGLEETDSDWVAKFIGRERVQTESYRLTQPLSPHESARLDGILIENDKILSDLPSASTVIEGAGGVLVPINRETLYVDLMVRMNCPVVVVSSSRLGTINHTLLTLRALREKSIEPLGVVMVGDRNDVNIKAVAEYGQTQILGLIPRIDQLTKKNLLGLGQNINLESVKWKE